MDRRAMGAEELQMQWDVSLDLFQGDGQRNR